MEEKFKPGWKVHPGELVKELFEERHESVPNFCHIKQISYFYMMKLMAGRNSMTPKVAVALSDYFGTAPANFWMKLQKIYDEEE